MNTAIPNPLDRLDPDDIPSAWTVRGLDRLPDDELLSAACRRLSTSCGEEVTSFSLHAPLELMARARLLPMVSAPARTPARQRVAQLAATWATADASAKPSFDDSPVEQPSGALVDAIRDGDPAAADRAFVSLCSRSDAEQLVGHLVDSVLGHLGGAAHGAIFLELLPRFRPVGADPALMGRTLIGEIARHPDWQLQWLDQPRTKASAASLTERLLSPRADGRPSSHFVQPTMALVDETGLAHRTLADVTHRLSIEDARRVLLPIAAMSMLQDEPANAPYGWTHCLTLPQATLAVAHRAADPQRAVDVAATYVLGFRATQSTGPVDPEWKPEPPRRSSLDILRLDPSAAAATAWHATARQRHSFVRQLVDHATPHHDAHLAKYTLACLDAGTHDPANAHLFLAAAAYLAAWWRQHDDHIPTTEGETT